MNDRPQDAQVLLRSIRDLAAREPGRYSDADSRVALGRALILAGADARQVLELFFDPAKKSYPTSAEPTWPAGSWPWRSTTTPWPPKASPTPPSARRTIPTSTTAWRGPIPPIAAATEALTKALELNPRHVDSLLFQADNAIDAEEPDRAEKLIKQVLAVNPQHPRAWAYRAVLAHLAGDKKQEAVASRGSAADLEDESGGRSHDRPQAVAEVSLRRRRRVPAARRWRSTPTIGRPRCSSARTCCGWARRTKAGNWRPRCSQEDQYNVVAYNLVTLHDNLAKFRTLETPDFLVRMDDREARIYGPRVLEPAHRGPKRRCARSTTWS